MPDILGIAVRLGSWIAMILLVVIMLLVTTDVVLRSVFSSSITGAVEMTAFLQALVVFAGIAYTLRVGAHISVDLFFDMFPRKARQYIALGTSVLSLGAFLFMTYAIYTIASRPGASREISHQLGIPVQPFKLFAALGVALMCAELIRGLYLSIRNFRRPESGDTASGEAGK